ncbi:hypothetical protein BCR34DRAFT_576406 [Clohesyomyces aquaticus]|uniref:Uncharacterized protein n=1 Tax=Clohesyomyces aquaticus TaxID=1231657 RepID=A0A1Y1YNK9_9PLEO|nr:hypothetical protein BCR34DRAFT_576406 [Clohesyomyces aquaticus]
MLSLFSITRATAALAVISGSLIESASAGYEPGKPHESYCSTFVSTAVQYYTVTVTVTGRTTVYAGTTKSAYHGYYTPRGYYEYPKYNSSSTPPPYTPPPPPPGTSCPTVTTTISSTVYLTSSLLITETALYSVSVPQSSLAFSTAPPPPLQSETTLILPLPSTARPPPVVKESTLIPSVLPTALPTPLVSVPKPEIPKITPPPVFNPGPSKPSEKPSVPSAPESQVVPAPTSAPVPPPKSSAAPIAPVPSSIATSISPIEPSATESAPPVLFTGGASSSGYIFGGSLMAALVGFAVAWM